jgi:translation elongation factor EF-Ts
MHVAQGQPLIKFNDGHLQAQIKENRLRQRINRFHIARLTLLNRYYHQGIVTAQLSPAYQQEDVALAEQAALRLTAEIEADRREKAVFDSRRAVLLAQLAEGREKRWLKSCCRFQRTISGAGIAVSKEAHQSGQPAGEWEKIYRVPASGGGRRNSFTGGTRQSPSDRAGSAGQNGR